MGESFHLSQASSSPFKFKRFCAHLGPLTILPDIPAIVSRLPPPRLPIPYPVLFWIFSIITIYHSLYIFYLAAVYAP